MHGNNDSLVSVYYTCQPQMNARWEAEMHMRQGGHDLPATLLRDGPSCQPTYDSRKHLRRETAAKAIVGSEPARMRWVHGLAARGEPP